MAATKKPEPEGTTTFTIKRGDSYFILTVPAQWHATFGPMPGAMRKQGYSMEQPLFLRFYDGKKAMVALDGVTQFWHSDIKVERDVASEVAKKLLGLEEKDDLPF